MVEAWSPALADTERAAFFDQFEPRSRAQWSVAHYAFSHPSFDTDWNRSQVAWQGGVRLTLSPKPGPGNRFDGASVRRRHRTGFGRYEVVLQAARGGGVVTGFFTYTGGYYGTRHDEIDIEILGKDTTRLHAAWFVDGQMHSRFIDLGFDAADRARAYAFEWHPDRIRWYAEGRLVFETSLKDGPIPAEPGYLFVNIWAADPSIATWSGVAAADTRATAVIRNVRYTPFPGSADRVSPPVARQSDTPDAAARIASTEPEAPKSAE